MHDPATPNPAALPGPRFRVVPLDELPDDVRNGWLPIGEPDAAFYINALCEFDGDRLVRVVETDGGEPEDQTLTRDWSWVADALNEMDRRAREADELREAAERDRDKWKRACEVSQSAAIKRVEADREQFDRVTGSLSLHRDSLQQDVAKLHADLAAAQSALAAAEQGREAAVEAAERPAYIAGWCDARWASGVMNTEPGGEEAYARWQAASQRQHQRQQRPAADGDPLTVQQLQNLPRWEPRPMIPRDEGKQPAVDAKEGA